MKLDNETILKKIRTSFHVRSSMKPRVRKKWLTKLVSQDDPEAMLVLSTFATGRSDESFAIYRHNLVERAAKLGFPPAISCLAELYWEKNDFARAYSLYEKAAELGVGHALDVLAVAYELGLDGLEKDLEKARSYAERAKTATRWDSISGFEATLCLR